MKSLKYGQITETTINGKLYDDNITFSIIGKFFYETFSDYKDKMEVVGIMGKCRLSKDFNSIEIIDLYIDTDSHILIQKENYSTIEQIIKSQINSYEMIENIVMKRMEIELSNCSFFTVEIIKMTSIEFIPQCVGIIKGTLYTRKNDKKDYVIIDFYVNSQIVQDNSQLLVINIDILNTEDLNNYEIEYAKLYIEKYINSNGYFLENLLEQKKDYGEDNDLQFTF